MRIAVLCNDDREAELICEVLHAQGHGCERLKHGRPLLPRAAAGEFDLLLIDWQSGDGEVEMIGAAFAGTPRVPILLLAERSREDEIVAALSAGADDYMLKPLRRAELATRVTVLLRRAYPQSNVSQRQAFGAYAFETPSCRITLNGHAIKLTRKEFDLALLFFRHLGRPLSRAYLQETIWPGQADAGRSVDTHVSRIRSKLALRPENGFRLAPVYSFGYRLEQVSS